MTTRDLPRLADLDVDQIRGFRCVWDGAKLGEDAVDLGRQRCASIGRPRFWYPRACPGCVW